MGEGGVMKGPQVRRPSATQKPSNQKHGEMLCPLPLLGGAERSVLKSKIKTPPTPFFPADDEFGPSREEIRVAGDSAKSHEMEFTSRL